MTFCEFVNEAVEVMQRANLRFVQNVGGHPAEIRVIRGYVIVVESDRETGKPQLSIFEKRDVSWAYHQALREFRNGEYESIEEAMFENWPVEDA